MFAAVRGDHRRHCGRWIGCCLLAVILSGGRAANPLAAPPADLRDAGELSEEQAREIAALQARKPSLHDVTGEAVLAQRLEEAGVPAARIAEFQAAVRELELWPLLPAQTSYELRLLEFLLRTSDRRWLEMAGEFREVLYLPRLSSLSPEVADLLMRHPQEANRTGRLLVLPALNRLDPETARALCRDDEDGVVLPGITTLTPDVATALAGGGVVSLPGLTSITPEAARPLVTTRDAVFAAVLLTGVTELPPPVAQALAETQKLLVLRGLRSLGTATAELLAGNDQIHFDVDLIRELTPSLAARLANRFSDGVLRLGGVSALSVDSAERLAGCTGGVSLPGLTTLSPEAAAMLARCQSGVELPGLTSLSPELARSLATCPGDVSLPGLDTIPPALAAVLPDWKGFLSLGGLRTLSTADATTLTTTTAAIRLAGITQLSADVAEILGRVRWLELPGIETLSAETAAALAAGPGTLRLDGLRRLSPEAAQALVGRRDTLMLYGLTELDAATAKPLAACPAELRFARAFTTLSPDAAAALATHAGPVLLPGLTNPAPEVADQLLQNEKILFDLGCYASRTSISPAVATALAKRQEEISLAGIEALDSRDAVSIARALATKRGPLALPKLKKLSPKTLLALLEKEDIEIPAVDELELISEPDGSPTEDFVIPERLERKKKSAP